MEESKANMKPKSFQKHYTLFNQSQIEVCSDGSSSSEDRAYDAEVEKTQ